MRIISAILFAAFMGCIATPAGAAQQPCNLLRGKQCVECAKSRGFTPEQYLPYCGMSATSTKKTTRKK